jgi:hypothetical protein
MATTSAFGWQTPDDTSLVKDGAAAIRTLGNSIDTSMAELKGGTTGQVLAKASNTDMDFVWSADAAGISPTIFAAKGDLLGASANDTPAILAVGANGETLVADSSTSTGLRWNGSSIGKNAIYNSAFSVWQRGTSFGIPANTNTYTADRWFSQRATTGATVSRQTGTNNSQYDIRIQRNSGDTSTNAIFLAQVFEIADCTQYQGKTVTWSFWARKGSNYSASSDQLTIVFLTGTGTTEGNPFVVGYTGQTAVINTSVTLTSSWQRFSVTATLGATVTQFNPYFQMNPTGTAGANDFFELSNVQLELGSVATPFATMTGTIQGELSACQRYYWRAGGNTVYQAHGDGIFENANQAWVNVQNPVTMRTTPTSVDWSTLTTYDGATLRAVTNIGAQEYAQNINRVNVTISGGGTQSRPMQLFSNNSLSGYLGFSAEL